MNITFAPFWKRLVAFSIDIVILVAIYFCTIFLEIRLDVSGIPKLILILIFLFSLYLLYPLMESSKKQATLGKLLMGIVVVNVNGSRISFFRAFGRHLVKFGSTLFFFISIFLVIFRKKKQAYHDSATKTIVINKNVK